MYAKNIFSWKFEKVNKLTECCCTMSVEFISALLTWLLQKCYATYDLYISLGTDSTTAIKGRKCSRHHPQKKYTTTMPYFTTVSITSTECTKITDIFFKSAVINVDICIFVQHASFNSWVCVFGYTITFSMQWLCTRVRVHTHIP